MNRNLIIAGLTLALSWGIFVLLAVIFYFPKPTWAIVLSWIVFFAGLTLMLIGAYRNSHPKN